MSGWHLGSMVAFDTESTGVDVETDRIVTACVALVDGTTGHTDVRTWLVNPGIDIPDAAAEIHGITTEHAREHGRAAEFAVGEIADTLAAHAAAGVPVVGFNLAFDLTLLDRETRRHGLTPLADRLDGAAVIDPAVLDKHFDPYRKGSRKLADVCAHYRVRIDGAHDASHDALAAARVAYRIAQTWPGVATMPLAELHALQVRAKATQAASFRAYLERQGKPCGDVRGEWPLIPLAAAAQGGAS